MLSRLILLLMEVTVFKPSSTWPLPLPRLTLSAALSYCHQLTPQAPPPLPYSPVWLPGRPVSHYFMLLYSQPSNQHLLFTCHAPLHTSYSYKSTCSWLLMLWYRWYSSMSFHMFSSIRCPLLMAQRKQFSSQHPSSERPPAAPPSSSSHRPVLWVTRTTPNYHHCLFYSHH